MLQKFGIVIAIIDVIVIVVGVGSIVVLRLRRLCSAIEVAMNLR